MIDKIILDDLFGSHRTFLPGKRCSREEVVKHFTKPILLDGLTREEAFLILSTLPANTDQLFLSPLDKGLSGSKVFSAKFDVKGRRISKLFVLKLGSLTKIKQEYDAIEQYVSPHIHGVIQPVYRVGKETALIVQELAGLASNSTLISLKQYIRRTDDPVGIISRLLSERLGNWYQVNSNAQPSSHNLNSLFKWYLSKVNGDIYPADWITLKEWVKAITGFEWRNIDKTIQKLKDSSIRSFSTTVHGDLHSQNILIDEREECWPIDFAWCHDETSPVLDFTMLECSLKFLAIPQRSDLRTLIKIENLLCLEPFPEIEMKSEPYSKEIQNVIRGVIAVRSFAINIMKLTFEDYKKALCLMTYIHSTHPVLNLPYVLASLQILTGQRENK